MIVPLKHPQEIEVWYILPAIRKELVRVLKEKGKNGKEIAGLLGITAASVSQYSKDKRGHGIELPLEVKTFLRKQIVKIKDPKSAYRVIQDVNSFIKKSKVLCKIHLLLEKDLEDCDVCYA